MRGTIMKINRNKTLPLLIAAFLLFSFTAAYAEEEAPAGGEPGAIQEEPFILSEEAANEGYEPEGEHLYHYPEIEPQYSLWGGYRAITLKGSERAAEFESLKDSPAFGGSLIAFPFPVRLHLELDFLTDEDYFTDVRFAYKDTFQVRLLGRSLVHNLGNIKYPSIDTAVLQPDAGEEYALKTGIYKAFLRAKLPDYPLHFYIEANEVVKKGDMQARHYALDFALGMVKKTEKQPVDWKTTEARLGVNSHLGPVEVDLSHAEKRFDAGEDNVLRDPVFGIHHLIPDFEGSINELKIHSSYTGRLVAAATFMTYDRENEESHAEADYFIGAGHVRYLATDRLTFVLKYRHKDLDLDNPRSLTELAGQSFTLTGIRPSISSTTDTVTGIANYKVSKALTLGADAKYRVTDREDAEAWHLPDETEETVLGLNATYRPLRTMKVRAKFAHVENDDPAWTFQPDSGNSGSLSVSWTPVPKITGFLTYELAKEKRSEFPLFGLLSDITGHDRDVTRDKLTGSVSFLVSEAITVTPSYSYWHNRVRQDLAYTSDIDEDMAESIPDDQVRYTDTARNYSLAVSYMPEDKFSIGAEVSHTRAHGNFYSDAPETSDPTGIGLGDFSKLDITETVYSLSATYEFMKNTEVGLDYSYTDFNTKENELNPEDSDGIANVILVSLTKRWL